MKTIYRLLAGCLVVSIAYGAAPTFSAPISAGLRWMPYQNPSLHFALKLPDVWQVQEKDNVVGFTSPVKGNTHGAMGILKSSKKGVSIQEAASKGLGVSVRAAGWTLTNARFGGLPAVKVVSAMKDDPTQKMVQYYVQEGEDLFLIQCIAPVSEWSDYNALFATMIRTFQFSIQ